MGCTKRIVCLANSFKPPNGRCIAGIEILGKGKYGGWIRPVSARVSAELSFSEYKYRDSRSPRLLDIIDVPLLSTAPHNHQTENHIVDGKSWWEKVDDLDWSELEELRQNPPSIWINSDSTIPGVYDCMSPAEAATLQESLLLIKPKDFKVEVGKNSFNGRKTYRGKFDYKGTHYNFILTDPDARAAYSANGVGDYPLKDVYLCVSLTEPYKEDGRCHKLVAAIIKNPPL
jgi:hypothetical protein